MNLNAITAIVGTIAGVIGVSGVIAAQPTRWVRRAVARRRARDLIRIAEEYLPEWVYSAFFEHAPALMRHARRLDPDRAEEAVFYAFVQLARLVLQGQPQPRSVRRLLVNLTDEFIEKDFGRRVLAESGDYGAPSYDPRPEVPNP